MQTMFKPHEMLSAMCQAKKKWGIFLQVSNDGGNWAELQKAVPFFSVSEMAEFWHEFNGVIFLDSEEELQAICGQIIGDEGPTSLNTYNGFARVYALSCGPDGTLYSENT